MILSPRASHFDQEGMVAEDFLKADPLMLLGVGVLGLAVPIFFPALRPQLAALLKAGARLALSSMPTMRSPTGLWIRRSMH